MWILGLKGLKTVNLTVINGAKGITVQYHHGNTHRHYSLDPLPCNAIIGHTLTVHNIWSNKLRFLGAYIFRNALFSALREHGL